MDNEAFDDKPIMLGEVLGKAILLYKERVQFFLSISLVYAIVDELVGLGLTRLELKSEELIFLKVFFSIIIISWASIPIFFGASRLARGKPFLAAKAFSVARKRYAVYLVVYVTRLLILGCGFMLFVIPCLYFMTLFIFTGILVVSHQANFRQAFEMSARTVRPYFWKVFTYQLIVIGLMLIPELLYQMGAALYPPAASALQTVTTVLLLPYLMIAQVVLFYEIRSRIERNVHAIEEQIKLFDADD